MTRIYTNIPSMVAQRTLQTNMSSLQTSLQRLSTGLRINSGKDDPAGLIASEMLRSEVTSIKQGITNTERANNMIAVADSALNEIAGLLNQIRGLVNEAANTGTMSLEMLKSNQMQVDMMLDSIDRIASQTTFMGRKLLDGSLDFEIGGIMRTDIQNLRVYEAKFGDKGTIDVEVKVREAAQKASLYYSHTVAQSDVELTIGGNLGQATQRFEKGATVADIAEWVNGISSATGVTAVVHSDATYGQLITSSVGPNNDIVIRAGEAGQNPGFFEIKYVLGNDRGLVVDYQESLGPGYPAVATVYLQTTAWESARATHVDSTAGIHDNNALEFIANIAGEKYNDVSIHYVDGNLTDPNFADATKNSSGISRGINSYYSDVPKAATAVLGDINGLRAFASLDPGQYLTFTATKAGSEMNNVRIEFVESSALTAVAGNRARAELTTDTNGDKVYRIYVDTSGDPVVVPPVLATTFKDIQDAVNLEGSFRVTFHGPAASNPAGIVNKQISYLDVIQTGGTSNPVYGNTSNSGGDAKTLYVVMTTANPPAYMGLQLNKPINSFANFAVGDSFLLEPAPGMTGYANTKLNFEVKTKDDPIWTGVDPLNPNVIAKYDEINKILNVYIRSQDNFVPPLAANGIENVTFAQIQQAIHTATDVTGNPHILPWGAFQVTLGGTAATQQIALSDLNYPQPKSIGLTGLNPLAIPPEEVFVRWQPGYEVNNIKFIEGAATSAAYDPTKKLITVTLAAGATVANVQTALQLINIGGSTGLFDLDILGAATAGMVIDLDDIIPATALLTTSTPLTFRDGETVEVISDLAPATQVSLQFVKVSGGAEIRTGFDFCYPLHTLTVYIRDDANITYADVDAVLRATRVPTSEGSSTYVTNVFRLDFTSSGFPVDALFNIRADQVSFPVDNAGSSGFSTVGTAHSGVQYTIGAAHTANDVKNSFDMNRVESKGNERASELFTVWRSRDNDGTGVIYAAQFEKILTGGQDGGKVVNIAQDVVAALNNSKYWGTEMTQAMLQKWYAEGIAESRTKVPVIVASLAPGNHGLTTVSPFSEVAYYGSPYDGTGIQFLGPNNTRPIRFVVGGPDTKVNSPLSLDWTSIPDKIDFPRAILTSANANAELIITAKKQGEALDDVYFRFVRAEEDVNAVPPIVRGSGWGTYDYGPSYAEAQLTFNNVTTGASLANTAFYITANDRGDVANNTNIVMRQDPSQEQAIVVNYDAAKKELQISLRSSEINPATAKDGKPITTNDIIAAINKDTTGNGLSDSGFTASLSYSLESNNNGFGTFEAMGLATIYRSIGNTGNTGGHSGTVTIYLVGEQGGYGAPTANQIINIIRSDDILSTMFDASAYTTGTNGGTGIIDFVKDTGIVSTGGIAEPGVLVVHLATDGNGLPITTAADLVKFWDQLTAEQTHGISASLLREPNAIWDECNDPNGQGILPPTPTVGEECEDIRYLDTYFVGWSESGDEPLQYIPHHARGTMTSVVGEHASFDLVARRTGPEFNGYTLTYIQDNTLTGKYDDNVTGPDGTILYKGLRLTVDEKTKQILVYINEGVTTANDIKQLIETNPRTKQMFMVELRGNGTGKVTLKDDTLLTAGGTSPPGSLGGAKLLFGRDASEYALEFLSEGYGSRQYVSVIANNGSFPLTGVNGKQMERAYGIDADVTVNGVKAFTDGNDVTLSTSSLSMDFELGTHLLSGYTTTFTILGGGATFQMGPQVVANQQITMGIPSVNTNTLGGPSGKMYMLRTGGAASLSTSPGTKLADRIVQEAIVSVTSIRGRLGSIQKYTFEPNVNVLSDTLEALSAAESDIRDTDFAEESSNLTRNQVLVQSAISTLGIANQLPNYILGLLQR
ncbi:MAG: hypothetical protein FWC43_00180 [Planctomycetaceae bacterium]|nr:hypothetical protein [Planctomycetaceae bacterium]